MPITLISIKVGAVAAPAVCDRCAGRNQGKHEHADESPFGFPGELICSACEAMSIKAWREELARDDEKAAARERALAIKEGDLR